MKTILRTILHIESLVIIIATLSFVSSLYLKQAAVKVFDQTETLFSESQENLTGATNPVVKPEFLLFLENVEPYTIFDDDLQDELKALRAFSGQIDDVILFSARLNQFYANIHKKQNAFSFSYDCLLYFSVVLMTIAIFVLISKRLSQKSELSRIQAINEEQRSFSRNLHDGVAQDLAAVQLYQEQGNAEKSTFYAKRALHEVRYLIDSLHINLESDIESLLQDTADAFSQNHGIPLKLIITSTMLSKMKNQTEILRIVQESLSNIARHSNATEASIKITDIADELHIVISDNGKGLDEGALTKTTNRKHWGLHNIRERTELLGGTVEFINKGGLTIAICIKNPVS